MPEIEKPIRSDTFERIPAWYNTFVSIHHTELFQLVEAANYMDIKPLMDLTCAKIASMIKDKTVEEIRTTFDLPNDVTPEEEAAFREEMKWCEDC
jgi:S-phase kinase-associated protein 1